MHEAPEAQTVASAALLRAQPCRFILPSSYPIEGTGMATAKKLTTVVSTKGQVILPKAIRRQRRWEAGTRLIVKDTQAGVLLKAAPLFAPTSPQDVFGSLGHAGPPKTLKEMEAGLSEEARRRYARNRY
jgi:AbrB family looped-hinge helix DNA binding protein